MNSETPIQKFECHAIIELMGHQQMAGHVTEQTFGPASFFRVEVPATTESASFTRILNPSAIYAINPVTEAVAKARAEQIKFKPINAWDIRQMIQPVPKPALASGQEDDEQGDDENEDADLPY